MTLRKYIALLRAAGRKCTLLGVGPVSEAVVHATFEAAATYDCPAIFVASRNQVDLKKFGHGYLMGGMDQYRFVAMLKSARRRAGCKTPLYICRDHGGPWQRNRELDEKYPVKTAMAIARESFRADIEAGFNYLHIDPTKCPHPFTAEELCAWTVELLEFCETTRKRLGAPELDYEVGTEDIKGGLTAPAAFRGFLEQLCALLRAKGLPLPTCVVGQTGTLVKMDRNVGRFDKKTTRELAAIAEGYGIGFKEHNGDYLSAASCRAHPGLGVTAMNVAPEFGLVETDACLELCERESKLAAAGRLREARLSNFKNLVLELTFKKSPWRKWMTEEIKMLPLEAVEKDKALRLLIARVCGHYVFDEPAILEARRKLYANVERCGAVGDAERFVTNKIRRAIEFYMSHFKVKGLDALVKRKPHTQKRG